MVQGILISLEKVKSSVTAKGLPMPLQTVLTSINITLQTYHHRCLQRKMPQVVDVSRQRESLELDLCLRRRGGDRRLGGGDLKPAWEYQTRHRQRY